jgi:hypothetical protein
MDFFLSTSTSQEESTIQNKGFLLLDTMFKNNGWKLITPFYISNADFLYIIY